MPARTGQQYITGLQEHPREVWIEGERVQDVTTHPALRNGVRSVAALYDMQHDPALREEMTYASPTTGHPVGLSFLAPQSVADLERRRTMIAHWAWASCGMMGRSLGFLNVPFSAWAGAARDRARLFHLAWDVSCSAFAGRQVLCERMFGGNAVRNARTLFHTYDREPFRQRVHAFVQSADGKGGHAP
jgi:aromatic ring hydroxylase